MNRKCIVLAVQQLPIDVHVGIKVHAVTKIAMTYNRAEANIMKQKLPKTDAVVTFSF